ncbi:hypothetical protein [Tunicatimonas pelagia]|uniref:hypothetical protein n=1 Tax=Tunicatimonas pelagia TaxID=931531 RepID=UPI0026663B2B|nr:hypothetical protein [Tunicatimonas pelagia]WKN42347.1 hypothetical protein P0M28_25255 [Tunicatimonas pelagia]
MVSLAERRFVLQQHMPLASYVAMLQGYMIEDELEFAESEAEKREIMNIYDAISYREKEVVDKITEKIFYHLEDNILLYPLLISSCLHNFFVYQGFTSFYAVAHVRKTIIGTTKTDYAPVQATRQALLDVTASNNYDEAYVLDTMSVKDMVQHLFWIARCDASAPEYIFLYPKDAYYFISICKYGNIHFYISGGNKSVLSSELKSFGLQEWQGREYERFSNSGGIEGRFTNPEE